MVQNADLELPSAEDAAAFEPKFRRVVGQQSETFENMLGAQAGAPRAPAARRSAAREATGKAAASLDLTRFSSWAKERQPARVIFGPDRRPESITASLILGTSITIRFRGQA